MLDIINKDLNTVQKEAVLNTEGANLIVAGAGSGKTRVLTYKIAHLLEQGVNPSNILALTFTNKAAKEMKERISSVVGFELASLLWMGTFHSIFSKILRFEADKIGYSSNFTIYDTDDAKSLLRSILRQLGLKREDYPENGLLKAISDAKNNLVTATHYPNISSYMERDKASKKPQTHIIYNMYEQKCKQADAMDFDDLLMQTNILFRDSPETLEKYRNRFHYILVDEYQDTNFSQYYIIKKLSELRQNITVVGDDAQSIYSFRGARIENILNFKKDYPNHQIFKLEQNYRSTQNIVDAANDIIRRNKNQIPKKVFSKNDLGRPIHIKSAMTDTEEGFLVVGDILELRQREHLEYSDFAILYRTNMQSRIMEEALRKRNIPYRIYGGFSFYQRKEIKDIIAYLRVVSNPKDNEALKRIINFPARGIGKTTMDKLETLANEYQTSIWNILTKIETLKTFNSGTQKKLMGFTQLITLLKDIADEKGAYEVAEELIHRTGLVKLLEKQDTPEAVSQKENIMELLNGIKEYGDLLAKEEGLELLTLSHYLENVSLLTSQDTEDKDDNNKVSLMTIHSAKGLEFKSVYLVGVERDLFPSMMSKNDAKSLEEERRLFYVAMTRAEKYLTISYSKNRMKFGKFSITGASFFIDEINPKYVLALDKQGGFTPRESGSLLGGGQKSTFTKTSLSRGKLPFKKTESSFTASPSDSLQAGMRVEHQRFGKGKILQISQVGTNKVATVFFEATGNKQLLLKFAKLKIIDG